jgi:type I restriction enzyme S subunit
MTEQAPGLLGSAALVPDDGSTWLHNQRIGLVTPDEERADQDFVCYLLNSPDVRTQINATATGTKVRHTAPERIEAVAVPLPPISDQRRIAAVLSAFDVLTAVNKRRIRLLEELARSLYREWFVHFRFPGHKDVELVESDAGSIPKGWSLSRLTDFAEVVVDSVEPSEFEVSDRYVGLEHLSRRSTTLHRWGSTETVRSRKLRFARGDTLFGKIRPNLHKVAWASFSGLASSDTVILRPRIGLGGFVNSIASSDRFVAEAVATANGTKMPRADPKAMLAYQIVVPDKACPLLAQFNEAVERWLSWSGELVQVNQMLGAARDLLLPWLVTGQLDVSDIELGALVPPDAE